MLTIKAPLELTCNPSMISSQEAFYHRVVGNYEVMSCGLDREDLLHVMTAPPEIYLEESGMTSLVQNTKILNHQEQKLTIINNLLNRIAVMEDVQLTYQDRVYITDVLQKLGIQDVKQFMHQVTQLKQETQTTEQLISLYWNHLGELRQMVRTYHSQEATHESKTEQRERERVNLHETIMDRLQTGAIYQILHNFHTNHNRNSILVTHQELQLAEQKRVAVQVLLHQLKNEVQGEKLPLVYRHENYYESMEIEEGEQIETAVTKQINSAVLLDLIDHLYLSRFERQQSVEYSWLSIEQALYQTAENTLYRIRNGFFTQVQKQSEQKFEQLYQQTLRNQELNLLQTLLLNGWEAEDRFFTIQEQYGEEASKIWNYWQERAEISYRLEETTEESEDALPKIEEKEQSIDAPQAAKQLKEQDVPVLAAKEENKSLDTEQKLLSDRSRQQIEQIEQALKTVTDEAQIPPKEKLEKREEAPVKMYFRDTNITEDLFQDAFTQAHMQWVEEGQRHFYQAIEQYLRFSKESAREVLYRASSAPTQSEQGAGEQTTQILTVSPMDSSKERTIQAAETVLLQWQGQETEVVPAEVQNGKEHIFFEEANQNLAAKELHDETQNVLQEYRTEQQLFLENRTDVRYPQELQTASDTEEALPELPMEHPEDEETILQEQLQKINQQNIANYRAYQELLQKQEQERKKALPVRRDMKKDSLKALQDPEGLLLEYRREKEAEEEGKKQETKRLTELLPEQTRRLYQRLEQYLENPQPLNEDPKISKNNTALLLHDIQQIETEQSRTEQIRSKEKMHIQETSREALEKWKEMLVREGAPSNHHSETAQVQIPLVHRSNETQLDEELIQTLLMQNRTTKGTTVVTEQEVQDQKVVQKTVHQQTQQILKQESEDITELIQRGVQRQIGAISDQIYTKLEKRLQNEKKRRGY